MLQVWQVADSFSDLVPKTLFENAVQLIWNFTPHVSWLFLFLCYHSNMLGMCGSEAREYVIPSQACWYLLIIRVSLELWLWASLDKSVRPK